ncbi:MAG: MOMP family protein [Chlamydiales bacterium]|nr:MOMP family protein [Chlamydiales bacterium]
MTANIFKKIPIALAAVAFASASAAMDMDSRVTQLEQQMAQVRTENTLGTFGAKTAPASPDVIGGTDWFLELALLYAHPRIGGTEYAYSDDDPAFVLPINGTMKDVKPNWNFGVLAGIGIDTTYDDWQLYAEYTYLGSSGSSSMDAGLNGTVIPLRSAMLITGAVRPGTFDQVDTAEADFSFTLNSVTLQAARDFFVSKTLSLRPFTGVTSTWLDLKENVTYSGGRDLRVNSVYVEDESDFWGIGPVAGLSGKLHLGYGFSVYTDVSGVLYFGNFDVEHEENFSLVEDDSIELDADFHRMVPAVAMGLGLVYERFLDDNRHHIAISLGYDTSYFWRANQMLRLEDNDSLVYGRYSEDVYIDGLKLELRWDF